MILDPNCFGQEYSLYQKYLGLVSSLSNLFSDSDTPYIHYREFVLVTPDNTEIKVSLCQGNGGGKALMSAPNTALSEWFHLLLVKKDNGVITYDNLNRIGKDSVLI